jgi:phosphatidylinositol alpha-mannosyltransferase
MRALLDERFDVLHLHEPFVPGPALTASLVNPAPVVATFHAAGEQPAYDFLAPLGRWIAKRFDARVAVSQEALDLVAPVVGGDWSVLYNGVDIPALGGHVTPPRGGHVTAKKTVFFLGRPEPRKGLEILLQAEPMLAEGTTIWVAGEGESTEQLSGRYRSGRIQWLGRISDEERDRRLAEATVFCAPSLGGESFGIILLEAMAAGTAVVASCIPGYEKVATGPSPDGVPQEQTCAELAEPGNPASLARSINLVLGDPDYRESLVAAGSLRAGQFNLDGLCKRYLELYQRVLAASG